MITLKNVGYGIDGEQILRDITLDIKEGSFIVILGANGSGKTSLLKHLNALYLPETGSVEVDGLDTRKSQLQVREKVGYVFQNPEDQLVYSTVEEDVAFGLENKGVPTGKMKLKVSEILKKIGISSLAKRNVNTLSFGQKQLVALAGVLVMEPRYLILDEPTATLDPRNKRIIITLIKRLCKERGIGIILSSNILEDARLGNRVVVLKQGAIIFDGKPSQLSKTRVQKAGLYA